MQTYIVMSGGRRVARTIADSTEDAIATVVGQPREDAEVRAYRFERVPQRKGRK